jgi:hypothetical protein
MLDEVKPLKDILIMIPTRGTICVPLVPKLIKWCSQGAEVNFVTGFLVDYARNLAVKHFLTTNKTHLLFLDDDTIPEVDGISKLLSSGKLVVGGLYNLQVDTSDRQSTKLAPSAIVDSQRGLQKVDRIATGFLLIRKEVFEKIPRPWFEFEWDKNHDSYLGEDYSFCEKVKKAGFDIYCDPFAVAKHYKSVLL